MSASAFRRLLVAALALPFAALSLVLAQEPPEPVDEVKQLAEQVGDANALVRREAALALGQVGAKSPVAYVALREASLDANPQVRAAARASLGKVERPSLKDLTALVLDKKGQPGVHYRAVFEIVRLHRGPKESKEAALALRELLVKADPTLRPAVAIAMEQIGRNYWATGELQTQKTKTLKTGMSLVPVEPGKFVMGAPRKGQILPGAPTPSGDGKKDDTPAPPPPTTGIGSLGNVTQSGLLPLPGPEDYAPMHLVEITQPFFMAAHEVTVGQFRQFVEKTGYKTDAERDGKGGVGLNAQTQVFEGPDRQYTWQTPGFAQGDDHPVVNVSWNDARKFCDWLSQEEGRVYDLPTEAEWEYACRAGTQTMFWNGNAPESLVEIDNVPDKTVAGIVPNWNTLDVEDGFAYTAPVGKFKANPFRLHDMHGNVREWCADSPRQYDAHLGRNAALALSLPLPDPRGDTDNRRVIRGGSFLYGSPLGCASAFRAYEPTSYRHCFTGFRVVLRGYNPK
jgi:formylglycine-generating enzyme required for sulfatase activity